MHRRSIRAIRNEVVGLCPSMTPSATPSGPPARAQFGRFAPHLDGAARLRLRMGSSLWRGGGGAIVVVVALLVGVDVIGIGVDVIGIGVGRPLLLRDLLGDGG
eukprot:1190042-Prorocentrum_minimum.AAC.2